MSEFRSAYSGHVRHTSLTGNGHEPEYEYKVTETGRELVKTGENDVYALIQSRLDETNWPLRTNSTCITLISFITLYPYSEW